MNAVRRRDPETIDDHDLDRASNRPGPLREAGLAALPLATGLGGQPAVLDRAKQAEIAVLMERETLNDRECMATFQ